MRRGPDAVKLELWRRRLVEFERGTETVAAFCRRVGVSAATFYSWRRRVARLAAETRGPQPLGRGTPNSGGNSAPPLSFLPVQVTSQPRNVIEVVLASGTRVLVPSGDRQSLRMVLELALGAGEQPSC
jgi:transposase-like protein